MRLLEKQRQRKVSESASIYDTPRAVVTLEQLLRILVDLSFSQERMDRQIFDSDSMLEHLNDGLDTVLRRRAGVNSHDQGQAQSLFQETHFLAWLESEHPDMILVDGNMEFLLWVSQFSHGLVARPQGFAAVCYRSTLGSNRHAGLSEPRLFIYAEPG